MKICVLAIGKLRGPEAEACAEYLKRMAGDIVVREMAASKSLAPEQVQKAEAELLLKAIPEKAWVVLLDERGKDMTSRDFAAHFAKWQEQSDTAFIIGGADGVTDAVRARANVMIGFGRLTWPHRLVRVMLLEQIYRARQINAGHPYHRD